VPEPAPDLLIVENLSVYYGAARVLWDVSFRVKTGEVTCIIGSNGAGKTTTLNTVAGIIRPKMGRIVLAGADVTALPPNKRVTRRLGLVPEGRQLWPGMSVEENLLMGAFPPEFRKRAEANIEGIFGMFPRLKERRHQLAGTLSGGEQQMCAIGRGLMAEPKLLMLDEPSLGLAPKLVDEIFRFVAEIVKHGVTILLVAQNVEYTLQISNYGYVMETGRIILEGPSQALLHNEEVRQAYLGHGIA
jgi:branched-chain amino acid transport system ATP-binding protein